MDRTKQFQTVLSLCSGYGGLERGIDLAGVGARVVAYVEVEAFAVANLVAKMEEGRLDPAPIWSDLKTFPLEIFRNRIDILVGGYPCQPFSTAGQRQGRDDPRHLWPYVLKAVDSIRPLRVFFENVEGHVTRGLSEVLEDLEGIGYRSEWGLFSAEEVGAPHRRRRVFIMADTDGCRSRENLEPGEPRANGIVEPSGDSRNARPGEVGEIQVWPARPGEVQKIWEEPRVIEPGMGRATDGTSARLDRLRLLGNGVVPATASRAWQVLSERLENDV